MKIQVLLISLSLFLFSCTKSKDEAPAPAGDTITTNEQGLSDVKATIKTVHGNIVFKFYPKEAPNTVKRIIHLIEKGFYDGLTFHRVVPNFVIQGGDPTASGAGGSGMKLNAEFNSIQHIRGTVAMARAAHPDSADSQFYIARTRIPHLDGKYTVFGQVVDGLDVIDKVGPGDKMLSVSLSK